MEKRDYLNLVYASMVEHPDWLAETMMVIQQSTTDRLTKMLKEERELRVGAEVALIKAEWGKPKLNTSDSVLVLKALVGSGLISGTEAQKKYQERLEAMG